MKKIILVTLLAFCFSCQNKENKTITTAKKSSTEVTEIKNDIERIEPPYWWTGFKNNKLQLLVKHPNISKATPSITNANIQIEKIQQGESPNYLFIDLNIANAQAGKFNIEFKQKDGKTLTQTYELKKRTKQATDYVGFDSSDVLYLITPDRFANGDQTNDIPFKKTGINEAGQKVSLLKEATINRKDDYARHGGDIKGITQHLDYIDEMGFTAIWSCPLLTNDMPRSSYHGYAITDYYQVDPRFGTLAEYKELVDKASERGIKLIMDQVANHCGLEHWWMKDLPFNDWVNYQKEFENGEKINSSNHRRTANQDVYASQSDKEGLAKGWFVSAMPDLNQRNPYMAKYIIQNSIWWIESLGLSGIRQDTYPYPDKEFMSNWAGAIMTEYPNFSIVGEEWSYNPLLIGYWQKGAKNKDGYESNLTSTMDFAMQRKTVEALSEKESWDKGLVKIYEGLANDFYYPNPKDIMIFPDNHDMSRIFTQLNGDVANTKMALSYQLVLPRIPQIYYGTEILMNDFAKPGDHGLIRTDFPGGWQGDTTNAFTGDGLTADQKDMQMYLKKLLNFRKTSKAIHEGKTVHFAPFLGTYFLFRTLSDETVVHIINKNEKPITIDLKRYAEMNLKGKTLTNVITGEKFTWNEGIELKEKGSIILTTKSN
ncbi:glycoside hydrolase family 13 protein [Kordia algicida OT-1]|uniref:Alpha amylase, catalytic region n=1 Tax=Kordia algicida OT-1 TaxID=391587 RepID=A9DQ89_9FLAO|nr:glycoside hydrolase family 13 protein [Kordia algicida]EDP96603.1 alpha amylase, catalytic region [Kordia algicida OT-1]